MAAAYPLPGAYPGSVPPTPDEIPTQQPELIQEPPHQHNHHQRNQLLKSQDPRGHTAIDSGVGLTDSEPIYTSQKDYHWKGPSEAVGGGTYSRDHNATAAFESAGLNDILPRNPDLPSKGADQDVHTRAAERSVPRTEVSRRDSEEEFPLRDSEGSSRLSGMAYTGSSKSTVGDVSNRNSASEPPYWGSLPKAASGGIYNTVTGHGSANDDHAQHHGLPQRGGTYNTVAGHGSNDVENQRHSFSQSGGETMPVPSTADASSRNTASGPAVGGHTQHAHVPSSVANGALSAAPLPKIPEGEQKKSFGPSATETNKPAITSASIHNTPAETDALLAGPAPRSTDGVLLPTSLVSQAKPEPTPQRAFPLAPSRAGREDERRRSGSRSRDATLGAAAGLGAGAAAYGIADKRKKANQQAEPAPVQETRHSRSASEDQGHKATGSLFARQSREEKRSASVDKHKKQLHSEEKKHKVFSIFHRHKDDEPKEDISTYEPPRKSVDKVERKEEVLVGATSSPKTRNRLRKGSKSERRSSSSDSDRSGHGREKLAAAAGVGALGLHHHKKEENLKDAARKPQETAPTTQPIYRDNKTPTAPNKNAQVAAAGAGAGLAAGLGGYGMAKRNHEKAEHNTLPVTEEVSTPFEHPREPPMPPQDSVLGTSTVDPIPRANHPNVAFTALPSGAPAGPSSTRPSEFNNNSRGDIVAQQPGQYNHLPSGTTSGVKQDYARPSESNHSGYSKDATAMGAAGLAAAVKRESHRPSDPSASKGGVSDNYNHLPSGTASGVNPDHTHTFESNTSKRGVPDNYSHLHSGTATGVKRDASSADNTAAYKTASDCATSRPPNDRTDSGPYNKLPSGTPSGVKIKPKEHRSRQSSEPAVQSNLAVSTQPPRHSVDVTSSRKDLPLPPSSSSPTDANAPIHHTILRAPETGTATNPPPPSQPAAHFTSFPNPGMVQNMSPEVMPETYRQSVVPPHVTRQAGGAEKDVSPRGSTNDVVSSAAAWRQQPQSKQPAPASVSAPPPTPFSSAQTQNNTLHQSKDRSTVGPALAAATASWGVTGGLPTSNTVDKVMHQCEHCGRENDVTSLVRREQEKLKGGSVMPGSHGQWSRSK
ncbi:hypothetical protein QBC44DRAFT_28730 [Cladorrhinum sp. PSN332]|nr:hypothetical protein QBC44DRAFT_28730 [Cladorrhinum sp. PSN332]